MPVSVHERSFNSLALVNNRFANVPGYSGGVTIDSRRPTYRLSVALTSSKPVVDSYGQPRERK
jgi:hypothetical protein